MKQLLYALLLLLFVVSAAFAQQQLFQIAEEQEAAEYAATLEFFDNPQEEDAALTLATDPGPCKKCQINCMTQSTLFKSCAISDVVSYGCDIQDYCLTTADATDREVHAGIGTFNKKTKFKFVMWANIVSWWCFSNTKNSHHKNISHVHATRWLPIEKRCKHGQQ